MFGVLENKRAVFQDLHDIHRETNMAAALASRLMRWSPPSGVAIHFGELSNVALALPSTVVISRVDANAHGPRHDR